MIIYIESLPLEKLFRYLFHRIWAIISLTFVIVFVSSLPASAATSLIDVRSWTAPSHTRIVFDLNRPVLFQENRTKGPQTISIKFRNCKNATSKKEWEVNNKFIKYLKLEDSPSDSLNVEIKTSLSMEYHIFYLQKYKTKPDRIVIDIKNPLSPQKEKETKREIETLKKANWIIAIDPGHGGEDPGAISRDGFKEKDIVLSVGKKLKGLLDKQPGIKAYLTRDGDYFLSLRERIEIAHKFQADLFLSLHANASRRKSANGASVYYLSRDGATDEASALLADKENASDLIGGIPLGKDTLLDSILIDLAQTRTINESIDLGEKVLREIIKIRGIKKEGLKCANFGVLKSPSIPSVLVELAYLSNSSDRKLLTSKKYQFKMARMINVGVDKFLAECPPKEKPHRVMAKTDTSNHNYEIHIVRKGDTLWRIASFYGIPLEIIRKFNGLNPSSTLLVGQELKIPSF